MTRKALALAVIVLLAAGSQAACADKWGLPKQGRKTSLHATYQGHTDAVLSVAFNPADGRRFVSGGRDKTQRDKSMLRFWDVASGKCVKTKVNMPGDVIALDWSKDGRFILAGTDNYYDKHAGALRTTPRIVVIDPGSRRYVKKIIRGQFHEPYALAFSPDGQHMLIASMGKNFELWSAGLDPAKILHKRLLMGHESHVLAVAWSPDGKRIATGSMDATVRTWDPYALTKQLQQTMTGHAGSVNGIAWSQDGKFLASAGGDRTVRVWDAASGECRHTLEGHAGPVNAVVISPDCRHVVSVSADATMRVWDAVGGKCVQTFKEHTGPIEALDMSADGRLLVTGGRDRAVKVWVVGRY